MSLRVLILALTLSCCLAWSSNHKAFRTSSASSLRRKHLSKRSNPIETPPNPSATISSTSQSMLRNSFTPRVKNESKSKLSHSVLASCDTLPSFRTAHGLLSPETVMRLEEQIEVHNEAVSNFLRTYRKHGPLSCVPMLSDPDVLPHLTRAMRHIAN